MFDPVLKRRYPAIVFLTLAAAMLIPLLAAAPALAEQAGARLAEQAAVQDEKMSFLELLAKGRWFMVPIGLCSLLAVTIIIERLLALRRRVIIPPGFLPGLKEVLEDPRRDGRRAAEYCHSQNSPTSRVVAVGIRKIPQGIEAVEQGIEDAGANEMAKLRRNLRMLYGIAAIAPMLGLLGTVWGMIQAFQVAAIGGLGGGAQELASGIYEALVTTFAGLAVAIPVLMFYYFFQGRIERIVSEVNDVCEGFMEHYLAQESEPPAPPTAPASRIPGTGHGDGSEAVPSPA